MLDGKARWFLLAALSPAALFACGDDADPNTGGTSGNSSGGSSAGSQVGGSAGKASGGMTNGGAAGSTTGGATSGSGGGGVGGAKGGAGGASGSGGSGGGGGSGGAMPTAVANIVGANGKTVMGTATFTQMGATTKLVIDLTACPTPTAMLVSHLHLVKDCSGDLMAAGGHWTPNGEMLGGYVCADSKVTHMAEKPTSMWTVGGDAATDVTKYSFMVHEGTEQAPGGRIACGVINVK